MRSSCKKVMTKQHKREDPVLFYYTPIKKSGDIIYINLTLVVNDKLSGKLLPEQYLAVAEQSAIRIEKLNKFAIERLCEDLEKTLDRVFVVYLSPRMLKTANFNKLIDAVANKESRVVFAFNMLRLNEMGQKGKAAVSALRQSGVRILLDGIEYCTLKNLSDIEADIIRLDARLYEPGNTVMFDLIKSFCDGKNIELCANNVDTEQKSDYLKSIGLELMEGRAIGTPKRYLKNLA